MNPDNSPFTPQQPATAESFVGRLDELEELHAMVRMACRGELQIGWISGERGIGKSSLARVVAETAEQEYGALVAHVHLGGASTLEDLAEKVHVGLLKENRNKTWGEKLIDLFGEKVKRVGVHSVVEIELRASSADLTATAHNLAESLHHLLQKSESDRKVVFLILDDINGLAENPKFAHWLKNTRDGSATSGLYACVCLLFVGLQERFWQLREHNPSVPRVFRPWLNIAPWSHLESKHFFKRGFAKRDVVLDDAAAELCAELAGGVPTVAHLIGNALWRSSDAGNMDDTTIAHAVFAASNAVGGLFIEPEVIKEIGDEKHRATLKSLAAGDFIMRDRLSRDELCESDDLDASAADDFLRRMQQTGGLVSAGDGAYKFPTRMHQVYLLLTAYSQRTTSLRETQ